ncbi:MAG: MlaD family protein, partial [Bacteroidota bacterium]|nr:MCE family protein [Cytophagales bacterium]
MEKLISYFTTVFLLIGCLGINSGIEQKVIFNKVDNLAVGTAVVLNGYPVGNVASVRLDESYRIEAVLALDKGVQFPLDSRFICTQQMCLLHNYFINILTEIIFVPCKDEKTSHQKSCTRFIWTCLFLKTIFIE